MANKNKLQKPVQKPLDLEPASQESAELSEWLQKGIALYQQGRLSDAQHIYEMILEKQSNHFDALQLLALVHKQKKNPEIALKYFDHAIKINQNNAAVFNNRGNALKDLKRLDEALQNYNEAIRLKPDYAQAYYNRGITLLDLKRLDEALLSYEETIRITPDYAEAHYYRGNVLRDLKRLDAALQSYDEALRIKPDYAEVYNNRGVTLQELKRLDEALQSYDEALRIQPDYVDAYNNRGVVLQYLKRLDAALQSYEEALRIKHDYAEVYNNRGVVLQELKRLDEALQSYEQALRIQPDYAEAHYSRGVALQELKQLDAALQCYEEALRIKPDFEFLSGTLLYTQMKICDWSSLSSQVLQLESSLLAIQKVATPFTVLGVIDNPEIHLMASRIYVESKYPASNELGHFIRRAPDGKIRIAYYSADFHNHATAYLMAELFESHDPNRFEIYGFSFGPKANDEMRQRLSKVFNQFLDVSKRSDIEIAKLSRNLGIDIAVDLKGFTQDSRTGIFALRCAPIQVNYLGYPGTMAAPYIDYILADRTIIPIESQKSYTEKIVYMPHSYQVNDGKRKISDRLFSKEELGLPEVGFVFCCFNNNYKIQPETFDLWMDLLREVKGSVLWLLEDNSIAVKNLRTQAQQRGIDPYRLVFASRMNLAEHLARHRLADLFLDTLPCNAHTTASDALWVGTPVLTLPGQSFAARVAASLLHALDMPELIAENREDYSEIAIKLATNQALLKQCKEKLDRNRLTSPLFNGHMFAKHLEQAYVEMQRRYVNGQLPDHIYVSREG